MKKINPALQNFNKQIVQYKLVEEKAKMAGYSNVSGLTCEASYHCFLNEHTSSILIGQYNVMGSV